MVSLDLQHETLLWVHDEGLRGMDAKAGSIKVLHTIHEPAQGALILKQHILQICIMSWHSTSVEQQECKAHAHWPVSPAKPGAGLVRHSSRSRVCVPALQGRHTRSVYGRAACSRL